MGDSVKKLFTPHLGQISLEITGYSLENIVPELLGVIFTP